MNKRGAEFTITTLIVIVLAIIVLVVLALGFGAGWGNLWSKITGYFSPVNVDSVKQACQYAATTQASYDYCCRIREVKFSSDGTAEKLTCGDSRLKGEAVLSCSNVACPDVSASFKTFCQNNCDADDNAKKKNFCCEKKEDIVINGVVSNTCNGIKTKIIDVCGIAPDCAGVSC